MKEFWLCFVPLFVAVDAIGVLPLYLALVQDVEKERLPRILQQSVITAMAVALGFVALGVGVLKLLGITIADFMVAGGLLLLIISISDILATEKARQKVDPESLGAVPLGVPLIAGPAVLTTSILLLHEHGPWITGSAIVVNVLLAGAMFWLAPQIHRVLGKAGSKAASKVCSLILAAIAVMFIRRGIAAFLQGVGAAGG
jgi:multiple antibiotic resistance protein